MRCRWFYFTDRKSVMSGLILAACTVALTDCSGNPTGSGNTDTGVGGSISTSTGGKTSMGGTTANAGVGGTHAAGGTMSTGGMAAMGGAATGGMMAAGGMMVAATGGMMSAAGGKATGGMVATTGGMMATGGSKSTGGMTSAGGMMPTGGSKATGGMMSTGGSSSTAATTFTTIYTTIISMRCTVCHTPGGSGVTAGMLDMSTQAAAYANLVGVAAAGTGCAGTGTRVVQGNAAMSILWEKVDAKTAGTAAPCGSPMPLTGAALTQAQVNEIASWINAGAMNN